MKKLLILILCAFATIAKAQLATVDAGMNSQFAAFAMTNKVNEERKGLLDKIRHSETIQKWAEQLNNVREALKTARDMKRDIEGMYQLQRDLRNAYERVKNIREFSAADANYFLKYFLDIDLDPTAYIPNTPLTRKYLQRVQKAFGSPSAARALFYADNSILHYTNGMIDYANIMEDRFGSKNRESKMYAAKIDENVAIRAGLEESYGLMLMDQLSMLEEQIQKNVEDADRNRVLANDEEAKMSEADRAELNDKANRLMERVFDLKMQCHDIMTKLNTFEGRPLTLSLKNDNENYIVNRHISHATYNKIRIFR